MRRQINLWTALADPTYSVLDYGSLSSSPGNSGGPGSPPPPPPFFFFFFFFLTTSDLQTIQNWKSSNSYLWGPSISALTIQNDYLAITRASLSLNQATTVANSINLGTQTVTQYVNSLLSQVANTTIPAVAVEASMYGATGTSATITSLTTNFLPPQLANAAHFGLNQLVYGCEALGLTFAFGNESGGTAFANNFGPSNSAMPNTAAGDLAFAMAASTAIFGSAATANTPGGIDTFVVTGKHFLPAMASRVYPILPQRKSISPQEVLHGVMQSGSHLPIISDHCLDRLLISLRMPRKALPFTEHHL